MGPKIPCSLSLSLHLSIAGKSPCPSGTRVVRHSGKPLKLQYLKLSMLFSIAVSRVQLSYRQKLEQTYKTRWCTNCQCWRSPFSEPEVSEPVVSGCLFPTGCPINAVAVPSLEQQLPCFTQHVCHSPKVDRLGRSDAQLSCSIPLQISCTEV